ncbi:MAG: hypothetical protein PV345_05900 [Wolbachia sp.]|nr:hypothetical protein [Wolbachia sp.]
MPKDSGKRLDLQILAVSKYGNKIFKSVVNALSRNNMRDVFFVE